MKLDTLENNEGDSSRY